MDKKGKMHYTNDKFIQLKQQKQDDCHPKFVKKKETPLNDRKGISQQFEAVVVYKGAFCEPILVSALIQECLLMA